MTAATIWSPSGHDLALAESDLSWWHESAASELGARAAGLEPSGAHWDNETIWRLFEGLLSRERTAAVRRFYAVAPIIRSGAFSREHAAAVYHRRRYPPHLVTRFWVESEDSQGRYCRRTLVGAALVTESVRDGFAKAHDGAIAGGPGEALRWMSETVSINKRLPDWGYSALAEAREMRVGVLTAYAEAQRARTREEYFV